MNILLRCLGGFHNFAKGSTMSRARERAIADFHATLYRNFGVTPRITEAAGELLQLARRAERYNTLRCNAVLTEQQERTAERIDQRAIAIATSIGAVCTTNGDPRGFPFYLHLPDIPATRIYLLGRNLAAALCGGQLPPHRKIVKSEGETFLVHRQKINGLWQWVAEQQEEDKA
jgi:hypothetical protein